MKCDLKYVTNYMLDYDTGVPITVIIAISVIVSCITIVLYRFRINYPLFLRQASFCILCGYLLFVLCTTILYREETFEKRYHLYPFGSYTVLYYRLIAQLLLNVLMFIPIGFLVGGTLKKKRILDVIGIGFALTFFIELTQLITTRGVFNVDDIIHNVIGCIIGYLCFMLCYKIILRIVKCHSPNLDDTLYR